MSPQSRPIIQKVKTINKYINDYWHLILLAAIALGYVFIQLPYLRSFENSSEAVGVVTTVTFKSVYFKYSVQNKAFSGYEKNVGLISDYVEKGDSFVVEYATNEPSNYRIHFNRPVVGYLMEYGNTKSIRHEFFGSGSFVKYWYSVNNNIYERTQYLVDENINKDSTQFDVIFSKKNPAKGFICIDPTNCWTVNLGK